MLTVLCALALQQQQTISFTHPCAHSAVVLEKLGEKMGVKMAASGSVLQDFFAVRFTDRDPETIKRVIADTLNAVWLQRNDYLVLHRGSEQERKETDSENAAFRDGIERFLQANPHKPFDLARIKELMIAESKAPLEAGADGRSPSAEMQKLMPANRFAAKLARAIGTEKLAAVSQSEPLRYYLQAGGATNMPPAIKKAVEEYKDESAQVFELGMTLGATMFIGGYGPDVGRPVGYTLSIDKADLEIQVRISRERVDLPQGGFRVDGNSVSIMRGASPRSNEKRIELPMPKGKLQFSPEGLCMLRVVAGRQRFGYENTPYTQEEFQTARELAKDFATNEPLALYATAPIAQAMEQAGRDYVVVIPDTSAFGSSWLLLAVKGDLAEVWKHMHLTFSEDASSGILKLDANAGPFGRQYRLDRGAGSKLISAVDRKNRLTLDDLADFTKEIDNKQEFFFWMNAITKFVPLPWKDYGQWQALKVYGNLSSTQRGAARDGGALVEWSTLPKEVQDALATEVFSSRAAFTDEPRADSQRWISFSTLTFSGANAQKFLVPPIPRGTTLRVRVLSEDRLNPGKNSQGLSGSEVLTVAQFAQRATQSHSSYEADFGNAAVVNVERVVVDIFVPSTGYLQLIAQVDSATENTNYVSLDKLPEPWKTELAEAIRKIGGE